MGRPLKDIDGDEVFDWAKDGCTQEEIANHFGCARSVISERFRQEYELGKAASKTSLRRMQFDKARAGSDTMLIHLGKVYLGQTDRIELNASVDTRVKTVLHFEDNGFGGSTTPDTGAGGTAEGVPPVPG
jgi:hypothetical protein